MLLLGADAFSYTGNILKKFFASLLVFFFAPPDSGARSSLSLWLISLTFTLFDASSAPSSSSSFRFSIDKKIQAERHYQRYEINQREKLSTRFKEIHSRQSIDAR
jgi:hypothetical protein